MFALVAVFSAVVIALAVLGFAFTLLWAVGSKPPPAQRIYYDQLPSSPLGRSSHSPGPDGPRSPRQAREKPARALGRGEGSEGYRLDDERIVVPGRRRSYLPSGHFWGKLRRITLPRTPVNRVG
jgi:hypothetical protein